MGVAPQHQVGPVGDEQIGQLLLIGILGGLVLHSPVDHHGDEIGVQRPGGGQIGLQPVGIGGGQGGHVVGVEKVDGIVLAAGQGDAVGTVGIPQEGHRNAPHVGHLDGGVRLGLLRRAGGTHMGQPRLVQLVQGGYQPIIPTVQTVVVGGEHQIKAQVLQIARQGGGGFEGRIAGIRPLGGQGGLQVGHGVVRPLHIGAGRLKNGGVVVDARPLIPGVVGHRHVAHHVAAHRQGGGGGGLGGRRGRGCGGRGGGDRRLWGGGGDRGALAAGEDHSGHGGQQQDGKTAHKSGLLMRVMWGRTPPGQSRRRRHTPRRNLWNPRRRW